MKWVFSKSISFFKKVRYKILPTWVFASRFRFVFYVILTRYLPVNEIDYLDPFDTAREDLSVDLFDDASKDQCDIKAYEWSDLNFKRYREIPFWTLILSVVASYGSSEFIRICQPFPVKFYLFICYPVQTIFQLMSCLILVSWMWKDFDQKWQKILQLLFLTLVAIITDCVIMHRICVKKFKVTPILVQILNRTEAEEESTILQVSHDLANKLKIFKKRVDFAGATENQVIQQLGGDNFSIYDIPRYVEINLLNLL